MSLLLLDAKTPGVSVRKMPMQFDDVHNTTFVTIEDAKVPVKNRIGEEGQGFKMLLVNFNHERWLISIQAIRMARRCYEEAFSYALKRKTFGQQLIEHQAIRFKFAEMARLIEATHAQAEQMTYCYKAGVPDLELGTQAALLKVNASRVHELCAREASQIFGGSSLVKEGQGKEVERLYRRVRFNAIPGGSEEIMLDLAMKENIKKVKKLEQGNAKL